MPCAASPPSAFCQEKVTTSSLGQSRFCAKAAEVASHIVRPWRSALIQSALGTRTAERGILEILGIPARALGTGAGGEMRHIGPRSGLRCGHYLSFQIASLPLGGGVPPRCIRQSSGIVKELRALGQPGCTRRSDVTAESARRAGSGIPVADQLSP